MTQTVILEYGKNGDTPAPSPEMLEEIGSILKKHGQTNRIGLIALDTQNLVVTPGSGSVPLEINDPEKRILIVKGSHPKDIGPHIVTTKVFSKDINAQACQLTCPTGGNQQRKHTSFHENTSSIN